MFTLPKQSSKLSYLPLLIPVPSPLMSQSSKRPLGFSEAEIKLYLEQYEDGYDGKDDLAENVPSRWRFHKQCFFEIICFYIPTKASQEDSKIARVAISKPTRKN